MRLFDKQMSDIAIASPTGGDGGETEAEVILSRKLYKNFSSRHFSPWKERCFLIDRETRNMLMINAAGITIVVPLRGATVRSHHYFSHSKNSTISKMSTSSKKFAQPTISQSNSQSQSSLGSNLSEPSATTSSSSNAQVNSPSYCLSIVCDSHRVLEKELEITLRFNSVKHMETWRKSLSEAIAWHEAATQRSNEKALQALCSFLKERLELQSSLPTGDGKDTKSSASYRGHIARLRDAEAALEQNASSKPKGQKMVSI